MKKPPQINISSQVIKAITEQHLKPRARGVYVARRAGLIALLALNVLLVISSVAALFFSAKFEMFHEYLQFGAQGVRQLAISVPWLGLGLAAGGLVVSFYLLRILAKKQLNYSVMLSLTVLVLLIGVGFGWGSPANSPVSKLANGYRLGTEPLKIIGEVIEKTNTTVTVQSSGGLKTINIQSTQLYNGQVPEVGDNVLVLASSSGDSIKANAIKILRVKQRSQVEPIKIEAQKEVAQAAPEPKQEPKPVATQTGQPAAGGGGSPAPAPTPAGNTITVTSITAMPSVNPTKYMIMWTANFNTVTGWKIPYVPSPGTPSYPPGPYEYVSAPGASSGSVLVQKSTWGSGTFNVRICAYNTGAPIPCEVYSAIFAITF